MLYKCIVYLSSEPLPGLCDVIGARNANDPKYSLVLLHLTMLNIAGVYVCVRAYASEHV